MAALRGPIRAAGVLLAALTVLALLMLAPELNVNPLMFVAPG